MQKTIIPLSSVVAAIAALFLAQDKSTQEHSPVYITYSSNILPSHGSDEEEGVGRQGLPTIEYVPDEITAIRVAEAIWLPIYGEKIYNKRPFTARLARLKSSDVWIVEGTLKEGYLGGVPYIEIRKSDCKILKVTHGK